MPLSSLQLGQMISPSPTDRKIKRAAYAAAHEYISTATLDDRSGRLAILVDLLHLDVPPGLTKHRAAEDFLRRRDA